MNKKITVFLALAAVFIFFQAPAAASVKQVKIYKEAYPDQEKPKCIHCHVSEKPKKDDGEHDLNAYGKKVVAINKEPNAADYQAAGKE